MAKKRDEGHEETEEVLKDLEKRITKEYEQAEKEIAEKLDDYMRRFEIKDKLKRQAVLNGQITQEEYEKWRYGQVMIGERWTEMRDTIARDLTDAAQLAKDITNGAMPEVYAINHNYGTFQVEKAAKVNTSYTLYSKDSVARMFDDNNVLYHKAGYKTMARIKAGKQMAWDKKIVQSVMTQALLQGDSIGDIATRLSKAVGETDRKAAIRNARTMTTGVQNAGRVDSYVRASKMGIEMEQEWLATLDSRTRHEHRMLDGQRAKVGEKFKIDGYELAYPADPTGPAYLVYNCRCTVVPAIKGLSPEASDLSLRNTNHMEEATYEEWKNAHASESHPITKQDEIAENMKRAYGAEYRSYSLKSGLNNGIIESGAVSGALNPRSLKAQEHADRYYGLVRAMTTDVKSISENTGMTTEEIQRVKDFVFFDEHDLSGGKSLFLPNYDMAESWQRLIDGNFEPHDLTMLKHELLEMSYMEEGYSQADAHILASKVYNYTKETDEYNDKISKHKKNK